MGRCGRRPARAVDAHPGTQADVWRFCAHLVDLETADDLTQDTYVRALGAAARFRPDRRAAFVLTQLLGLSYAEAAETCEVPIGTIRSRVARAREDLVRGSTGAIAPAADGLVTGSAR